MKATFRLIAIFLIVTLYSSNTKSEYIQFCERGNTGVCVTGAGGWEAFKCDPTNINTKDCKGTYLKEIGNNPE